MTPIRVRGKKSRKLSVDHSGPTKHARVQLSARTRRSLTATDVESSEDSLRPSQKQSSLRAVSSLERLPTELIEIIFLESLNINLPRSSPLLGSALSSFHVKSKLFFKAFASVGDVDLVHENLFTSYRISEFAQFQSSILECKWMTLDFLKQYKPVYFEWILLFAFKRYQLTWIDGTSWKDLTTRMSAELVQDLYQRNKPVKVGQMMDDHAWQWISNKSGGIRLNLDLDTGTLRLATYKGEDDMVNENRCVRCGHSAISISEIMYCFPDCQIPTKLLHGPWTRDKCDLLAILTTARASIDWLESTRGEVAERGLHDALKERNGRAVRLLTAGGFELVRPSSSLRCYDGMIICYDGMITDEEQSERDDSFPKPDIEQGYHYGPRVRPRTEHLRTAVIDHGCQFDVVDALLKARRKDIDYNDRQLRVWGIQKHLEGDKRGAQLLTRLDHSFDPNGYIAASIPREDMHT